MQGEAGASRELRTGARIGYQLSSFSPVPLGRAMPLPDPRPWASLLLADLALLWLLQGTVGALLPQGLPGLWLEGTLRLGGLWGLLTLGGLSGLVRTRLPVLCLATPLFLSLRALVAGAASAPAARVASAPWSWLLLGYGAAGLSCAVWAVLSPPGAAEGAQAREDSRALMWRLLKLSRPDRPFLTAACVFLVFAVLGEWGGCWGRRWAKALLHLPTRLFPARASRRGDRNPSLFRSCD